MNNDSLSDFFTRIRNASLIRREKIYVPATKINKNIALVFLRHGLISHIQKINFTNLRMENSSVSFPMKKKRTPCLELTLKYEKKEKTKNQPILLQLKRLSRPGCRLYVNARNIPKICECGKIGIVLLSTSKGILSDREAVNLKIGGEILGFIS